MCRNRTLPVRVSPGRYGELTVKAVNYDDRLHVGYVQGSMLAVEVLAAWLAVFRRWLGPSPLRLVDVGSGAGRFTNPLAETFDGLVVGIEPSGRMRALAGAGGVDPNVCFVGGICEAIPLADHVMDAALLFGVWHHLGDRAVSAAELARVVRPHGTLLVRTSASDRLLQPWWHEWFPEVYETDRKWLPSLAKTVETISAHDWELVAVDQVVVPAVLTRRQEFERMQSGALSTLEHLDDHVVDEGMTRIATALARHPDADRLAPVAPQDLLVFTHD
jgi:SAM-dependent methyltransferase